MKSKIFTFLMLFNIAFTINGSAQKDYFVCFFGEGISVPASPVGHAFIGIGKGVPLTCDVNGQETEMVGFYPRVRIEGAKSFWFGPVDGQIKNDVKTKVDSYAFKKIDLADYIKIKLKIEEWTKKKYQLTRQDCISFFIDVAAILADIALPDRSRFTTPDEYVKQFITQNKN